MKGNDNDKLSGICAAKEQELVLAPGLGDKKVKRLYQTLHEPFKSTKQRLNLSGSSSGESNFFNSSGGNSGESNVHDISGSNIGKNNADGSDKSGGGQNSGDNSGASSSSSRVNDGEDYEIKSGGADNDTEVSRESGRETVDMNDSKGIIISNDNGDNDVDTNVSNEITNLC